MEVQRSLLDSIGSKIGVRDGDMTPWYSVTRASLLKLGCGVLLTKYYDNSTYSMLRVVYPEHDWVPSRFRILPKLRERDQEVLFKRLKKFEEKFEIANPEDWSRVQMTQLDEEGLLRMVREAGGLFAVLRVYKPDVNWNESTLSHIGPNGPTPTE